ncbi:hypothetical protein GLAREA_10374 [Glarea lozoyensis ATCC 20868]|uniref:DUF7730 domain-containing protein n=1 Tax=Glarea lozoyensis (strain ATCC 20868 / MF5171) TaxID=1116229 RepID=S3DAD1_GLAL2|nr:uncharacterized protein GLAREA_10374 [Glarea lozoyensis ATCC 20868]EPE34680.1 hypothetical protein GLAREA_10374 [Glarea lozoyensis ATCC 20868]
MAVSSVTGFMCLPLEVRLQIYHYCIRHERLVDVSCPSLDNHQDTLDRKSRREQRDGIMEFGRHEHFWLPRTKSNTILLLSRQISEEALDVLYGDNIFKVQLNADGGNRLINNFTEANRRRMRRLLITAEPRGSSYMPRMIPNNALWSSILPQLRWLRIVAAQPVENSFYCGELTIEGRLEHWINWLQPFLQCFSANLSSQTIVEMDDDGCIETGTLIKNCLPKGYREVQCQMIGNSIFYRRHTSLHNKPEKVNVGSNNFRGVLGARRPIGRAEAQDTQIVAPRVDQPTGDNNSEREEIEAGKSYYSKLSQAVRQLYGALKY